MFKAGQTEQSFKVAVPDGASGVVAVSISNPQNAKLGEKVAHKVVVCKRAYNSLDGAHYIRYRSGDRFEKYAKVGKYTDAMISFKGSDDRFIFWRGSSYMPFLDTAGGKSFAEVVVPQNGDGPGRRFDNVMSAQRVCRINA